MSTVDNARHIRLIKTIAKAAGGFGDIEAAADFECQVYDGSDGSSIVLAVPIGFEEVPIDGEDRANGVKYEMEWRHFLITAVPCEAPASEPVAEEPAIG